MLAHMLTSLQMSQCSNDVHLGARSRNRLEVQKGGRHERSLLRLTFCRAWPICRCSRWGDM